jgi:hypothetical protein
MVITTGPRHGPNSTTAIMQVPLGAHHNRDSPGPQDQQERPRQPGQRQLPLGDVEPRTQTQPGNGALA